MLFGRFTESAQKVLMVARENSKILKHGYIGTEHILVGILTIEGLSRDLLSVYGVAVDKVNKLIEEYVGTGDKEYITGEIPLTPRTKRLLDLSLIEARNLGHNYITPEHILLALISENDGVAYAILNNLKVNFEQVRGDILATFSGRKSEKNSKNLSESTQRT